jgi:hypothetical protein
VAIFCVRFRPAELKSVKFSVRTSIHPLVLGNSAELLDVADRAERARTTAARKTLQRRTPPLGDVMPVSPAGMLSSIQSY